jgi:hypothetical protein
MAGLCPDGAGLPDRRGRSCIRPQLDQRRFHPATRSDLSYFTLVRFDRFSTRVVRRASPTFCAIELKPFVEPVHLS